MSVKKSKRKKKDPSNKNDSISKHSALKFDPSQESIYT